MITPYSIELKQVQVGYLIAVYKKKPVYGPVNAVINKAELVGIIGPNGIGKSTLLRTIAGLQPCLSGNIYINNRECNSMSLKEKAQTISYVSTETVYSQHIRVNELIAMGRFPYTGWLGRMKISDKRAIQEAVKLTGISHLLYKPIGQLSDGERQKVMIARALAQDTPVVILDEPTAFLDLPARYEILRLLSGITLRENKTILFSTHDLSVALDIADKIWLMADNDIYQGAPEDLLISKVFRKLFLNSPAEFDLKSSTFRFKREYTGSVVVHGDNKYKLLTKRAMERIGFQTTEDEPEIVVHIICEHDQPCWQLIDGDHIIRFHSVYTLTSYLKNRTC